MHFRILLNLSVYVFSPLHAAPLADFLKADPKPETVVYKTLPGVDSKYLSFYVFKPTNPDERKQRPAIVLIHGGAWRAGDADVFFPHARYFASRGAVGISINYRLLSTDLAGPSMAGCLADCKSAIRHIRAHAEELGVDANKIAVMGDSAGGHLAAALGTVSGFDDPQDDLKISAVPNVMVLCNPIVDLTEGGWSAHIIRGRAMEKNAPPEARTMTPEHADLARRLSPLFQVKPGQPPTLLLHGLDDTIVTPAQAEAFSKAMKDAGNSCEFHALDGARHAFIIARYTAPETSVVKHLRLVDEYLAAADILAGPATLEVSDPPAWIKK